MQEINLENNKEKFIKLCKDNITRDGIDDFLEWLIKSDFFVAPSSTKFHGNVAGGLCQHSLNVYDELQKIVALNKSDEGKDITIETIILVSLFHDICKTNFYKIGSRNVKNEETGKWEKKEIYEIEDSFPMGHGEKSVIMLQNFMRLNRDEIFAIRWHMGGFDSAVKGGDYSLSKAYEECKLAVMLHIADMSATYFDE